MSKKLEELEKQVSELDMPVNYRKVKTNPIDVEDVFEEFKCTMSDEVVGALNRYEGLMLMEGSNQDSLVALTIVSSDRDPVSAAAAVLLRLEIMAMNGQIMGHLFKSKLLKAKILDDKYQVISIPMVTLKTYYEITQGTPLEAL